MIACVFAGPSLARAPAEARAGFDMRGPARQGDVYRAALEGPAAIGLVDGYFEAVPAVWHKEILWALSRGIRVYGAASIGALRAVELAPFGMVGVGRVFEAYRDGVLVDDDEVALLHGPAETGYLPLTEAMVNVRATLERATGDGVIDHAAADKLADIAKAIFYKDRTWQALLALAEGCPLAGECAGFRAWLPRGRCDRKRLDALETLAALRARSAVAPEPPMPTFEPARSAVWEAARRAMDAASESYRTPVRGNRNSTGSLSEP